MDRIGRLSAFTCPACRGALWELQDGGLLCYRCHTGHAFSSESLRSSQDATAEDAIYQAMRALEKKSILLRRTAEHFAERFPKLHAKQLAEAAALEAKAVTLRKLISGERDADTVKPAPPDKAPSR